MIVLKCAVLGIAASVFAVLLKKKNGEYSLILVLSASAVMFLMLASDIYSALSDIKDFWSGLGISDSYFKVILKSLGICLVAEFAADTCNDFGNKSLAGAILLVGKISILVISLPLMRAILEIVSGLINQ